MANDHHWCGPSRAGQLSLCPGSHLLCEAIRADDVPSSDAVLGTLIHQAVHDDDVYASLDEEDQVVVDSCHEYLGEAAGDLLHDGFTRGNEVHGNLYDERGELLTFGTMDVVVSGHSHEGATEIVCDWKTGRVPVSERSAAIQLGIYSGMRLQALQAEVVHARIWQPRTRTEHRATYTRDDLPGIIAAVRQIQTNARGPRMLLNPSAEACQYCRAKGSCPAARAAGLEVVQYHGLDLSQMMTARLGDLYSRRDIVDSVFTAIRDELRTRAMAGDTSGGYECRGVRGNRRLSNAMAAIDALQPFVDRKAAEALLDLSVTKLEKLALPDLRSAKVCSLKEAKELFEKLLDGILTRDDSRTNLIRTKEANDG